MQQRKKIGNYLLIKKIGEGQFGSVFKARTISDKTKVYAIKCISKKKLEGNSVLSRLFQTEMSVMSEINHPNIMHLQEFMETTNNYYLVLQYCNNGDLEAYMKKMGTLSEDEAVYFLMQILNGFKVLHKNKIMHRDVKLANFFLSNDQIVIGDFGFAKQGTVMAQTKLGTPITMAPEILTLNQGSYTNKADLWSIGVCFYQMLYGKTPFDATTYDDLKIKVRHQSGNKLKFPSEFPISKECQELLVSLIQFDPNRRIEWKDFFNHKLFQNHQQKNESNQLYNSMIIRENNENVRKEFEENQKLPPDTEQLQDPETIETDTLQPKKEIEDVVKYEQEEQQKEDEEENLIIINNRYSHQKKQIIFVMYTVRKLRNLAKMKYVFNQLSEKFMLAACLLLQKGKILNDQTMNSLRSNQNIFQLKGFKNFSNSKEINKMLQFFSEDDKLYQVFHQQMLQKFKQEVTNTQYRLDFQQSQQWSIDEINLLDKLMLEQFKFLLSYIPKLTLKKNVEDQAYLAILHFYYSIKSDQSFPFMMNDKIFDWRSFEKENSVSRAKAKIEELFQIIQVQNQMGMCSFKRVKPQNKYRILIQLDSYLKKLDNPELIDFHLRFQPLKKHSYFSTKQLSYYKRIQLKIPRETHTPMESCCEYREQDLEYITSGSQGQVFKALDLKSQRYFTIKRIFYNSSKDELIQILNECILLKELQHKNIVTYYGCRKINNCLELHLEYMQQGSLMNLIEKDQINRSLVREYTQDILKGLEQLHQHGIIHGDIKCENLLVDENNHIKLTDFGSCQSISQLGYQFSGSLQTMAPENFKSQNKIERSSDIWSLGCVVFQLATGFSLFKENNAMQLSKKIQLFQPLDLIEYDFDDKLLDFLFCCLQKDPKQRHNCYELLRHPFIKKRGSENSYVSFRRESKRISSGSSKQLESLRNQLTQQLSLINDKKEKENRKFSVNKEKKEIIISGFLQFKPDLKKSHLIKTLESVIIQKLKKLN